MVGIHRIQRVPPTEKRGRRQSSTVKVAIRDNNNVNIDIKENDVHIDTYRDSGPGGQHRNKTDSAVRATHIPTGTSVTATESRSQHTNRKVALERLKQRLQCDMEAKQHHADNANKALTIDESNGVAFTWNQWRGTVVGNGGKASMSAALKGRLGKLLK